MDGNELAQVCHKSTCLERTLPLHSTCRQTMKQKRAKSNNELENIHYIRLVWLLRVGVNLVLDFLFYCFFFFWNYWKLLKLANIFIVRALRLFIMKQKQSQKMKIFMMKKSGWIKMKKMCNLKKRHCCIFNFSKFQTQSNFECMFRSLLFK